MGLTHLWLCWVGVACLCLSAARATWPVQQLPHKNYEKYYVVVLSPQSFGQIELLQQIEGHYHDTVTFWSELVAPHRNVTLSIHRDDFIEVAPQINNAGIPLTIATKNLQEWIDMGRPRFNTGLIRSQSGFNLSQYNSYDDINRYLVSVARSCDYCSIFKVGESFEGRPMKALRVGYRGHNKKSLWIDGGIHAREWISPAAVLYIADKVTSGNLDPLMKKLLTIYDWFFLPVANPDGYTYSMENDRLWRKTRSYNPEYPECKGTDANRNWGYHWMGPGASDNPCSEIYAGATAFSEPETRAIRDFLLRDDVAFPFQIYLSFHSYGQHWMSPWGYTAALPDDYKDLMAAAKVARDAMYDVSGNEYTLGTSTNVLYAAAGGSDDWAKGVAGIKYSYTVELQDAGWYGFLLPEARIPEQGAEIYAGVRAFVDYISRLHE